MTGEPNIQRYDRKQVLRDIVDLFQSRPDWNGFISEAELEPRFEAGAVYFTHREGRVVCAVDFHHRDRSHTRVYHTVLDAECWKPRLWEAVVMRVLRESPHGRLISKVPADSEENQLWYPIGTCLKVEAGADRPLNVWEVRR